MNQAINHVVSLFVKAMPKVTAQYPGYVCSSVPVRRRTVVISQLILTDPVLSS